VIGLYKWFQHHVMSGTSHGVSLLPKAYVRLKHVENSSILSSWTTPTHVDMWKGYRSNVINRCRKQRLHYFEM
jgi:hypothetical protein